MWGVLGFHGNINLDLLHILVWKTFYFGKEALSSERSRPESSRVFVASFCLQLVASPGFFDVFFFSRWN